MGVYINLFLIVLFPMILDLWAFDIIVKGKMRKTVQVKKVEKGRLKRFDAHLQFV